VKRIVKSLMTGPRRLGWTLLLLLPLLAGCRTVSLHVTEGVEPRAVWSVAVFPFDDTEADGSNTDYMIYGYTGAQGSGAIVGRILSDAFDANESFSVLSADKLRALMRQRSLAPSDLATVNDGQACEIGREFGVTMVVRGAVRHYHTAWLLFIPWACADLQIVALDPGVNTVLWTARVADRSHVRSELAMVQALARNVALRVAEKLVTPAQIAE
jgi:hypothetical protein